MPPRPAAEPSVLDRFKAWYATVPPITRGLCTLSVVLTLATTLELCNTSTFVFESVMVIRRLQLWRLVSSFFLHQMGLGFAMNLFFLYQSSLQLEMNVFHGQTADYLYFLLVTGAIQLVSAKFLRLYILSDGLLLSVTYLWAQHFPEQIVTFMFGFQFKAIYLPWVVVGFDFLTSGQLPVASLAGVGAAHAYYHITHIYPRQGGRNFLATPNFLRRAIPPMSRNPNAQNQRPSSSTSTFARSPWSRRYRLGDYR